jgi:agmatinase
VIDRLSEHVYVSIDLDVLDPSIMSAVGTPEPGGMDWGQITRLLKAVADAKQIVGFDLVELSPGEGPTACSYTAAKLAYKMMAYSLRLGDTNRDGLNAVVPRTLAEPSKS